MYNINFIKHAHITTCRTVALNFPCITGTISNSYSSNDDGGVNLQLQVFLLFLKGTWICFVHPVLQAIILRIREIGVLGEWDGPQLRAKNSVLKWFIIKFWGETPCGSLRTECLGVVESTQGKQCVDSTAVTHTMWDSGGGIKLEKCMLTLFSQLSV